MPATAQVEEQAEAAPEPAAATAEKKNRLKHTSTIAARSCLCTAAQHQALPIRR